MAESKPFPKEMQKLRDMLDERGIEWEDKSDEQWEHWENSFYGSAGYDRIWRTWFETERSRYSVICGYGTYGREHDLLECMVDRNEPIGSLTAEEVIGMMEKEAR